ncbi:MAG: alcohol dehydrogenase catalytic domain-containing protein [Nitrososphaeria archaeon]
MRAAVLCGPYDIRVKEVPIPSIKSNEILVKIHASSICPTDMRKYMGLSRLKEPLILGHEVSGVVEKKGESVDNVQVGDRVVLDSAIYCYTCYYCRKGDFNYCLNAKGIGGGGEKIEKVDGSFSEYIAVPSVNAHHIGNAPFEETCLAEPFSAAIKSVHDCKTNNGDIVVVMGAGPIGLMQLAYLKLIGAKVIVSELLEPRRKMAERYGADLIVNPKVEDLKDIVLNWTNNRGADAVLVTVGGNAEAQATEQALQFIGKGGYVNIFAGTYPETNITVNPNKIHYYEIKITGTFGHTPFTFSKAVDLISSKKIDVKPIVTHIFPLEKIKEAFETATTKKENALKVIIKP